MDYGRLGPSVPSSVISTENSDTVVRSRPEPKIRSRFRIRVIILVIAAILIIASAGALIVVMVRNRESGSGAQNRKKPTVAIKRACGKARFRTLCESSLLGFPGSESASESDLVHMSVDLTHRRLSQTFSTASELGNLDMDPLTNSAYVDCMDLLEESVDLLGKSLSGDGSPSDVVTWLSSALTNQDTCVEGFGNVGGGEVKQQMTARGMDELSELVSNCLGVFAAVIGGGDFVGAPVQNRRLLSYEEGDMYPVWMSRGERALLETAASEIQADVVVSKKGNGTVKTIAAAIKKVPEKLDRRFIIYVTAGRYEEKNLKLGTKKRNVMLVGDGKGKTVITGGKNVLANMTTFHTASFAASGTGFIARDITFENYAGPGKHQAVALRVGADFSVVYRCSIKGYQDTLYLHNNRIFVRECDIFGTIDFIFGNAAAVVQNCTIVARKGLPMQKNTITASSRKDPNQNTGLSIQASQLVAEKDLEVVKHDYPTYLGRPWKLYSRTVYMQSYFGDHVNDVGWLEWNATFALDTLYYGEYLNYGPGSGTENRVRWPGYRVINSTSEAAKFTVAEFISGSSWLPSTGVSFMAGLKE